FHVTGVQTCALPILLMTNGASITPPLASRGMKETGAALASWLRPLREDVARDSRRPTSLITMRDGPAIRRVPPGRRWPVQAAARSEERRVGTEGGLR